MYTIKSEVSSVKSLNFVFKRAQFSIFVVLGIVLLMALGIFFYRDSLSAYFESISETIGSSMEEFEKKENLKECLQVFAEQGLKLVESQSTYVELPRETMHIEGQDIPSFPLEGRSLETIEDELSTYIAQNLESSCFTNEERYSIERGRPTVSTTFEEKELLITTNWDLQFRSNIDPTMRFQIQGEVVSLPSNFQSLFEEAQRLGNESGIHYEEQYLTNTGVNVTVMDYTEAKVYLLSKEEEYLIIAVEKK